MHEKQSAHLSVTLFWQLLKTTGSSWVDNKSARLGAALAFYSVLSLAPLLLLVLTAASSLWGREAAQGQILGQMTSIIGEQGAEAIQNILAAAAQNKDAGIVATITGIITLLFSASGVFGELQDAMNTIWKVKPRTGQAILVLLRQRFASFTMVVGSGFLMLVSLLVSAWLSSASHFINGLLPDFIFLVRAIDFLVSFGIISFLFALAFKGVPDTIISWRGVWLGGVLTAVLFMTGKTLIGLYLSHAAVSSTYGAAGSFVALLLWVYYSAQILFFGAEFAHAYSAYFGLHAERPSNTTLH